MQYTDICYLPYAVLPISADFIGVYSIKIIKPLIDAITQ
jgi:hypothetical protein